MSLLHSYFNLNLIKIYKLESQIYVDYTKDSDLIWHYIEGDLDCIHSSGATGLTLSYNAYKPS